MCGHLYIHTMSMRALVSSIYTACLKYIGNRIVIYRLFIQRARFISSVRCWSSMGSQLRFCHEIVIGWYCNFSNAQRRLIKKCLKKCSISKEKKQNFLLVLSKKTYRKYKIKIVTKWLFEYCASEEKKSWNTTTFKMW